MDTTKQQREYTGFYFQRGELRVGGYVGTSMVVCGVTAKTVKIRMESGHGSRFTFMWDGTGYKRQGQYLVDSEHGTTNYGG